MKRRAPILVFCLCAAAFVLGILQIFHLRFEQGDVYPPYSTLRADPLGAMAFYESLERLPGFTVRRDFSARNKLPESRDTTYLQLAGDPRDWRRMPESLVLEIEQFLNRGGRLVVACEPETTGNRIFDTPFKTKGGTNAPAAKQKKAGKKAPPEQTPAPRKPGEPAGDDDEPDFFVKRTDLNERWGFNVDYEPLPSGDDDTAEPVVVTNRTALALPPSLDWHSATLFNKLATNWQVIYARGSNAVVMERRFGPGALVFASDSFFVSNEALARDRHADLLAWLVEPNRLVVFDEAHLGVVEEPGVATLMRRYRLHGFIAGLVLLMGLFVWKNSFSLVPPPPRVDGHGFVAGRDSAAGFVNLLRRSIAVSEILKVCYEQWEKSAAARRDLAPSRVEQAKQAVAAELARGALQRNPVAAYQQVARILKPGSAASPPAQAQEERR